MIRQYDLKDHVNGKTLRNAKNYLKTQEYYYGIPDHPKFSNRTRMVNMFGDGSGFSTDGMDIDQGWSNASWMADSYDQHIEAHYHMKKMPILLKRMIEPIKTMLLNIDQKSKITSNTFNLAISNYFQSKEMKMNPNSEPQDIYPKECLGKSVLAFVTLYPNQRARKQKLKLQLYIKGKWVDYFMGDETILFFDSSIPYQVLPQPENQYFKSVIGLVLKSTSIKRNNPLNNHIAVSYNARISKAPDKITYPCDGDPKTVMDIYQEFNQAYHNTYPCDLLSNCHLVITDIVKMKKYYLQEYKKQADILGLEIPVNIENLNLSMLKDVAEYCNSDDVQSYLGFVNCVNQENNSLPRSNSKLSRSDSAIYQYPNNYDLRRTHSFSPSFIKIKD